MSDAVVDFLSGGVGSLRAVNVSAVASSRRFLCMCWECMRQVSFRLYFDFLRI